jgi:hypothetical protein
MIGPARPITDEHRHLEFIEVRADAAVGATSAVIADVAHTTDEERAPTPPFPPDEPGWSLWGDLDG